MYPLPRIAVARLGSASPAPGPGYVPPHSQGELLVLVCLARGAKPAPSIAWTLGQYSTVQYTIVQYSTAKPAPSIAWALGL